MKTVVNIGLLIAFLLLMGCDRNKETVSEFDVHIFIEHKQTKDQQTLISEKMYLPCHKADAIVYYKGQPYKYYVFNVMEQTDSTVTFGVFTSTETISH